ncbi:hypothetical protein MCEMSEM23_02389 [Rhabdaerophilaceae bacterium]
MTEKNILSRRALVAGTAALAVGPALAIHATTPTPIARLWSEAQTLASKLAAHRGAIRSAALRANDGVPGWMRLTGEANAIAEARYRKLVTILNTAPSNQGDLAILAKVSQDSDIASGARTWASEKLAAATISLNA